MGLGSGQRYRACISGGVNSFLETFAGRDRAVAKLALYRLWLGPSADKLKCLTRAGGDGIWGQLHGAYFLAEGDKPNLDAVFVQVEKDYGKPVFGGGGKKLDPIPDKPVPAEVTAALKHLPSANEVKDK